MLNRATTDNICLKRNMFPCLSLQWQATTPSPLSSTPWGTNFGLKYHPPLKGTRILMKVLVSCLGQGKKIKMCLENLVVRKQEDFFKKGEATLRLARLS